MDVWLQGWGLAALWVGAVALLLILCFVWSIWVSVQKWTRPADDKSPSQPEG